MIKFTIITLFQEALEPYLKTSMMWKATDKGLAQFDFVNLREFGLGPHRSVDDSPYGGGDGMLMRPEPVYAAIESVKEKDPSAEVIIPTPAGRLWTQELAREFAGQSVVKITTPVQQNTEDQSTAQNSAAAPNQTSAPNSTAVPNLAAVPNQTSAPNQTIAPNSPAAPRQPSLASPDKHYIIFCPHYEGYDERILDIVDHKICLGPYVLTGGELPALIIIDSIVRLIPGVLGGETSAEIESFSDGNNIEYPQYTKPYDFRGKTVPDILLSGNHGEVDKWRAAHSKTFEPEKNKS